MSDFRFTMFVYTNSNHRNVSVLQFEYILKSTNSYFDCRQIRKKRMKLSNKEIFINRLEWLVQLVFAFLLHK